MYRIVYTKQAVKDIPKLKAAHLDKRAKLLLAILREDPFQSVSHELRGWDPFRLSFGRG